MIKKALNTISYLILLAGFMAATTVYASEELRLQVENAERAFAKTMADRDYEAFVSFLSDEAVFFAGKTALNGKQAVASAWKSLYEQPDAPFSWQPEQVVVLEPGTLALSTGPVLTPDGKATGTFTSIWRLEASGEWKVIFDKGCEVCDCSTP